MKWRWAIVGSNRILDENSNNVDHRRICTIGSNIRHLHSDMAHRCEVQGERIQKINWHVIFCNSIDKEKGLLPTGELGDNPERRLATTDLCALGSTLLLKTGVVGVTLTDAGEVVACREVC